MFDKAFDLTTKVLMCKTLTDDEKLYLQKRNAKYALVQFLVKEKMNQSGTVKNVQFTPEESFDDTATIDVVNMILKSLEAAKNIPPFSFGDGSRISNPPHTNKVKKALLY